MITLSRRLMDAPLVVSSGIQFVGGNISRKAGATSGNTTIALNSGLTGGIASAAQSGDFVLGVYATASTADRSLSITDGSTAYTLIASELYSNVAVDTNLRCGYKFITGDTATTFGPTGNSADSGAMAVYVFRGVDTTTPLDVAAQSGTGSVNESNPSVPSGSPITPVTYGAFIVSIGAMALVGLSAGDVFNTPSELVDFLRIVGVDTNNVALGIGHKDDWTSGSFSVPQMVQPNSGTEVAGSYARMNIALRPA